MAYKTALSPAKWTPHTDSEDQPCPVCNNLTVRHRKTKSQGRPCNDDITHISRNIMRAVNTINPPRFSDLPLAQSLFLPAPTLEDLVCQHCHSIPNQPLEILLCHHLICTTCIGRITETDTLKCTYTPTVVTPENLSIPHPVVLKLLKSLLLKCPLLCGQILQLQDLSNHIVSGCTDATPPLLSNITVEQVLQSPVGSALELSVMGTLTNHFIAPSGSITYKLPTGKVISQHMPHTEYTYTHVHAHSSKYLS